MFVPIRYLTLSALCASLIGCAQVSTLALDASPTERITYATERLLLDEHSYNFDVNLKLDDLSLVDAEKSAATEPTPEQIDADKHYPELAAEAQKLHYKLMSLKNLALSMNIDMTGAVDMRQGKVEIIPAARFESQNIMARAKLPMLLDLKNNHFYIDPSAITSMASSYEWLQKYQQPEGTFYRLTLVAPEVATDLKAIIKDIPPKDFFKIYVDSNAKALNTIAPEHIQVVAVDEWGKKINANQQINIVLSLDDYLAYTGEVEKYFLEGTIAYFKQYKGKALPAHIVKGLQETDVDAQQVARALALSLLNEILPKDSHFSSDTNQLAIKQSVYLDTNNRLIGQADTIKLNLDSLKFDATSRLHLTHFGRPTWQINPKKIKVIEVNDPLLSKDQWQTIISPIPDAIETEPDEFDDLEIDSFDDEE